MAVGVLTEEAVAASVGEGSDSAAGIAEVGCAARSTVVDVTRYALSRCCQ